MQRGSIGALIVASVVSAVVYIVVIRRDKPPPRRQVDPTAQDHGKELDQALSPLLAMANSPEAATPCETSYNSILAGQNASKAAGIEPIFEFIAPHDDFIAKCEALPKDVQLCMTPRHSASHREECAGLRPPEGVLDSMRKLRPQEAQPEPPPISSAPPAASK